MKHTACGGWWEIRTDPQNSAYVVTEGAKKRDYGPEEKGGEGELKFLTEEEKEKRRNDAFANLEGRLEENAEKKIHTERLEELYDASEVWRNPYDANAKLRKDFREKRKGWRKEDRVKDGIQDKFSFGYEISDATETDDMRAKLVDFGTKAAEDGAEEAARRPLFTSVEVAMTGKATKGKLKSEIKAEKSRQNLQHALVGNTRVSIDPFLSGDAKSSPKISLGIKRKREEAAPLDAKVSATTTISKTSTEILAKKPTLTTALVDYDSD